MDNGRAVEEDIRFAEKREEYERDRDFIINSIKDALREKNVQAAKELVDEWCLVAKDVKDYEFKQLAQMTYERYKNYQRIQEYITAYQTTPENGYGKRDNLCERILQIDKINDELIQNKIDSLKGIYENSGNLSYEKRLLICNEMLKYDPENSNLRKKRKLDKEHKKIIISKENCYKGNGSAPCVLQTLLARFR